jgi:hypothetical protein
VTDYGHDLIFGTFITPQSHRPQDVVGLARLTASSTRLPQQRGRDPSEIRRLFDFAGTFGPIGRSFVQGPPQQWARQLLPLVIDHGDDPGMIERWGGEVAPALREAVARERATATS